ncbi:MAG: protein-methionine-sulfoxide reductase heme-binding subunit MsrQ [Gammaproteobacteria bacterium]
MHARALILLKLGVLGIALLPAARLAAGAFDGSLGLNPLETLLMESGRWALVFLLLALTVTPLRRLLAGHARWRQRRYGRRLSDWNWIVRLRRMIGLLAFFYAVLHVALYAVLDHGLDAGAILADVATRPFLVVGAFALLVLTLLAVTSTDHMVARLGRRWRRLHRLAYVAAVLVLVHFWWQLKPGMHDAVPYTLIALVLLGWRAYERLRAMPGGPRDEGIEVAPRRGPAWTAVARRGATRAPSAWHAAGSGRPAGALSGLRDSAGGASPHT